MWALNVGEPVPVEAGGHRRGCRRGKPAYLALVMCFTCNHHFSMSIMIQIRDVPETLRIANFKSRAALAGMSLSGYLLDEIRRIASQPTLDGTARTPGTAILGRSSGAAGRRDSRGA